MATLPLLRSLALAGAVILVCSACAPGGRPAQESSTPERVGNGIVIGDESFGSAGGSVLSILQAHVRGMNVAQTEGCPHIVLRGGAGRSQVAEVLVYVDGQRMSDTCILEGLNLESIASVEVFPNGVTTRPGYRSNSGGLILVFTKNGPEEQRGL